MPLIKKTLFLLCFFSVVSLRLAAFPIFDKADSKEECEMIESVISHVNSTQRSDSSSMITNPQTTDSSFSTQSVGVNPPAEKKCTSANVETFLRVPVIEVAPSGPHHFKELNFTDTKYGSQGFINMIIKDLDREETNYKNEIIKLKTKDPCISNETNNKLAVLEDTLLVIKSGQAYRFNYLKEKAESSSNLENTQQPLVSLVIALNNDQEMLNKNIDKIIDIAKRVEELHEFKGKWTIVYNDLQKEFQEKGKDSLDRVALIKTQINKAQEAINRYLEFAEIIRDKNIMRKDNSHKPSLMAAAKEAKERGHSNYCSVLEFEANEQAADYERQATKARIQGNETEAQRYGKAYMVAFRARSEFLLANWPGLPEDEKTAWSLKGRYELRLAQAIVQGNEAETIRCIRVVSVAESALEQFEEANKAGISEEEKNARNLAGQYGLQQAQAIIQGNEIEVERYRDAIHFASYAVTQFQEENKDGVSEEEKNARNLAGQYSLRGAQAVIQRNKEEAKQYDHAAALANRSALACRDANKAGISEEEKNALNLSRRYYLQQAEAIIQGNKAEAKQYEHAATAALLVEDLFKRANSKDLSESERSRLIQLGNTYIAIAERLSDGRIQTTDEFQHKDYELELKKQQQAEEPNKGWLSWFWKS